ncbi:hypothetical protein KKD19_03275 [Patescibacteria group bacterium]|nr:hypothetical protein [Patescibacteria group bacterium]MCG2692655.1 hypothetical protein [Candidatus Parcubacteria bacterium]
MKELNIVILRPWSSSVDRDIVSLTFRNSIVNITIESISEKNLWHEESREESSVSFNLADEQEKSEWTDICKFFCEEMEAFARENTWHHSSHYSMQRAEKDGFLEVRYNQCISFPTRNEIVKNEMIIYFEVGAERMLRENVKTQLEMSDTQSREMFQELKKFMRNWVPKEE